MKKLIVYHGDSPVCVEGFAKECKRSVEGALHLHPGKPKTVTDEEYQHILDKYEWMKPKLKVVAKIGEGDQKEVAEDSKKEEEAPPVEDAPVPEEDPSGDSDGEPSE